MINAMFPRKESMNEVECCLDPQLWHACAGGMVQMPVINSKVIYFPQGHIEHAQVNIDLRKYPKIPPLIPCKIIGIKYLANYESDEVYAKVRLVPLRGNEFDTTCDDGFVGNNEMEEGSEKPVSFAKTLTQSDANNGGGFSVPRYCAETIFPRLDYSAEPPVQTILAKDVHGVTWKFRHIYRGTPRRHLLTTGWSNFVNQKKLIAGDSIVFLRTENGDLFVGIRRPKRELLTCGSAYGGFAAFLRNEENNKIMARNLEGMNSGNNTEKVRAESVVEAAYLAADGKPFEVVYYPRASTPEFFVKTAAVRAAMRLQWCAGMRFKMAFETEDSSRISWFMGTVSCVQVVDHVHWPNSPWRLLQVAWDEPDLLQNVKRVNPWSVESVASMPTVHMSPFSPPRKKLRVSQVPEIPFADQYLLPTFPNSAYNPSGSVFGLAEVPAGVQGARHAHFRQFLSDHLNKVNYSSLLTNGPELKSLHCGISAKHKIRENISSFLTMATLKESPKENDMLTPKFMLFGKPILTKQQISQSSSSDSMRTVSDSNLEKTGNNASEDSNDTLNKPSGGNFPCKVFMESEDVGNTLSLSSLGTYDGLYKKIAHHIWQGKILEAEQCALS
ncbi:auxin response factor 18 isoform X1 [Beta vulgaris subsp. vulgaris]|uniref:auxin response factor 18 isoform X1 n=2 Tax=Beta vulgaris subsp. vulgaris TaxID=3555 RepID=UPI0005402739|nr:auxin response factor 18 isoform X1 [Beta vulgaris subsp. vulgaris]XP_057248538.1 auxin response factor 18 isoform X1 [Beta vulgaris subsp. vulgaris]